MIDYVLSTIITAFSAAEIVLLIYNHKISYRYKFWIAISFFSEVILWISWILTGIFLHDSGERVEPIWVDYVLATTYLIIAIFHFLFLVFTKDEKIERKRKFYYDEKTGMYRKYFEERFNDGRQLYCASSLIRHKNNYDSKK